MLLPHLHKSDSSGQRAASAELPPLTDLQVSSWLLWGV